MINQYNMKLESGVFDKVCDGSKIIESRLYDRKRQLLQIGDNITFCRASDTNEQLTVQIVALLQYESFLALFNDFPCEWFGGSSKKELLEELRQFYSEKDEKEHGIRGIKIKRIKKL